MFNDIKAVLIDDAGQGLAEYGLILALVSVACFAALTTLAGGISGLLGKISAEL